MNEQSIHGWKETWSKRNALLSKKELNIFDWEISVVRIPVGFIYIYLYANMFVKFHNQRRNNKGNWNYRHLQIPSDMHDPFRFLTNHERRLLREYKTHRVYWKHQILSETGINLWLAGRRIFSSLIDMPPQEVSDYGLPKFPVPCSS